MPSYYRQQPPWDFQCPYQNCCPHLEGLSTQWVWEKYHRSYDAHLEHWKVRDTQQEDLEKASEYIIELEKQNWKRFIEDSLNRIKSRSEKLTKLLAMIELTVRKRKSGAHQKATLVGSDVNPIILTKPLSFRLQIYARIAHVRI